MASHDHPVAASQASLAQLNERSREIFRLIVESYLATGEPVGSRNLSRILPMTLSPASVRNVMSDLEQLGLVYAPHTSAGRLPTEIGLRFFVDALMQIGDLTENDRKAIEAQVAGRGQLTTIEEVLTEASGLLSGLSRAAGVVLTAKSNQRLKHIEFVRLEPERALVVLVAEDGQIENRVLNIPVGLPTSALVEASNFLNARVRGRTLAEVKLEIVEQEPHPLQIGKRLEVLQEMSLAAHNQLALVALAARPARKARCDDFLGQFVEFGLALLEPPLDLGLGLGKGAAADARIEEIRRLDQR